MVKKQQKSNSSKKPDAPLGGSIKDSAQQIWQAGLGAFNKAQLEGAKAFESLVKEGAQLQRKTQAAAEEKLAEASGKASTLASDLSSKASGQWDKLETLFEDRVAKVLKKLGVPAAAEVSALAARVEALERRVQQLTAPPVAAKTGAKTAAKTAVKTTAKTAAKPVGHSKRP